MQDSYSNIYANAGVDITAGYEVVEQIKPHIKSTFRQGVLGEFGGFGGMFEPNLSGMKRPIAVSGTDGVGTKLKIAFLMNKHDTIGIDCVAMCVNDIVCTGAEPLFFLDYIATGKNNPNRITSIIAGIADGCRQAGCALVGGETAEHPGMMPDDEYDLAGFSVGFVDFDRIIDGKSITEGDSLIGLPSSGLHSNGYSLVRKVFESKLLSINIHMNELGTSLGEELLRPTKIYVKPLLKLIQKMGSNIKGICNITGGGYYENIPRILPEGIRAQIDTKKLNIIPIFDIIQKVGNIPTRDMYNTFNMGIGMILVVNENHAEEVVNTLKALGENPVHIGKCIKADKGVDLL